MVWRRTSPLTRPLMEVAEVVRAVGLAQRAVAPSSRQ
jgi:hypothetical protein